MKSRRARRAQAAIAALMVAGGLAACRWLTGPLPSNAERFTPPAVYARWWAMTEACSGRTGDLRAVRWYRVPGPTFLLGGQAVAGYWGSRGDRIVLASEHVDDGAAVRHEMLHALLQRAGHTRTQFLEACASLVDCAGLCLEEAGPWHPPRPDYVVLPTDSLDVGAEAELRPSESDGQRWLALRVTARNPGGRAGVVAAPGDPVMPHTFGYDLRGPYGGLIGGSVALDSSVLFFQPGETKAWLFEFRVDTMLDEHHVTAGTYLVRGSYAWRWPPFDTVAVSP